jgi:hypothetical protein
VSLLNILKSVLAPPQIKVQIFLDQRDCIPSTINNLNMDILSDSRETFINLVLSSLKISQSSLQVGQEVSVLPPFRIQWTDLSVTHPRTRITQIVTERQFAAVVGRIVMLSGKVPSQVSNITVFFWHSDLEIY